MRINPWIINLTHIITTTQAIGDKPPPITVLAFFARRFLLLAGSFLQPIYRYSLPTAGWSTYPSEIENSNLIYDRNLVGATSALQPDDQILAVEALGMRGQSTVHYVPPPAQWKTGQVDQRTSICTDRNDAAETTTSPDRCRLRP